MKLVYPAKFYKMEGNDDGYTVEFPDLPGCVTEGNDLAEAIFMAQDAASGWVLTELEDGRRVPKASPVTSVKAPDGGMVCAIALDMDSYAEKYGNKAVKKTLTIPAWMNTYVKDHGISCSQLLQDAIGKLAQA